MQNTVQNQNNAGVQFNYPDFSQTQPQTQQPAPSVAPVNTQPQVGDNSTSTQIDQQKLDELKKSIGELIDTPTPPVQQDTAPVQTPAQSQPSVTQPTQGYVQELTPLPNLNNQPVPATPQTPPTPQQQPQQQQVWGDEITKIMPEQNTIKAMKREKKEDNLAQPLPSIQQKGKDGHTVIDIGTTDFSMDLLFEEVIKRNASDLHITPGYPPIIRVDGQLIDVGEQPLSPEEAEKLVLSIVPDDKKELLEVNREIDFAHSHQSGQTARFRINAFYTMKNISAALRLIPTRVKTIEELALPQVYHQITKLKQGLVLVTGPTGHGKSTTLAAMLEDINRNRFEHIITIEDPIEYIFDGKKAMIDQREMNDDTNSWAIALRSAMRQDPDVILVGEMRDYETIAAAITLAETGHLVFATLHTNNAAQTIDRVIDVFPENQQPQVRSQLSNILQVVIAQRLIPLDKGGRRAVSEVMFNNSAISNLIREGKTYQIDNVIRTSSDVGMIYLEKSLVSLVREGLISMQKAQEYAVHPEEVIRLLKT